MEGVIQQQALSGCAGDTSITQTGDSALRQYRERLFESHRGPEDQKTDAVAECPVCF